MGAPELARLESQDARAIVTLIERCAEAWLEQNPGAKEPPFFATPNKQRLQARFLEPDAVVLGALAGPDLVGVGLHQHSHALPECAHFGLFYVDPRWQGQGFAATLHAAVVRSIRSYGYPRARLWTQARNRRARAFYTGQGWQPLGPAELRTVYPDAGEAGKRLMLCYELRLS